MSTISNKFFIQVLEEGSSLHGQLLCTKSLVQSYKDGTCIPDWASTATARPLIYLSLQNGTVDTTPDNGYTWSYNGTEITFSSTQTSATIGGTTYYGFASTNFNGVFFKTGTTSTNASPLSGMPALGVIGNLASSSNVDIDVIRFDGSKTLSSNPIPFAAMINVTITQWTSGGYLGILSFPQGNVITTAGQTLQCSAILYNDSGEVTLSASDYEWYYEGDNTRRGTGQTFTIQESDITDYAILRCDFYITINGTRTLVYSAFGSIDDQQDPEYMWIKYNGANGNSTSLRTGENVVFSICVGTQDDDTPSTDWTVFKAKFLDSEGNVVIATTSPSYTVANDSAFHTTPDANGYRALSVSSGVATAKVYYDDAFYLCKKGLTGVVVAETSI